jgi:hypothetical protein
MAVIQKQVNSLVVTASTTRSISGTPPLRSSSSASDMRTCASVAIHGILLLLCTSMVVAQTTIASSRCLNEQECLEITKPTIIVDANDWEGIHIAVEALADDFERVTSTRAILMNYTGDTISAVEPIILVGSVGNSSLVQQIDGLDTTNIEDQWEMFTTSVLDNPIEGVDQALVIAGSDKRGTIFGIYTLSEDIGVSP